MTEYVIPKPTSSTPAPPPPSYADEVMADSPALYWRLGESSGTDAVDASGNGHDGTYTGGFTLAQAGALAGDANTAVNLNGSTGYVTSTYNPFVDGTTRTFEGWAKRNNTTNIHPLVGRDNLPGFATASMRLYVANGSNDVLFQGHNGSSFITWANAAAAAGAWFHWALIWIQGTSVELYVNGVSQGVQSYTDANDAVSWTFAAGAAGISLFTDGLFDEIAVYESALSATRILAHYNAAL